MLALRQPPRLGWGDVREATRMDSGFNGNPHEGPGRSFGAWKAGDAHRMGREPDRRRIEDWMRDVV